MKDKKPNARTVCVRNVDMDVYYAFVDYCEEEGLKHGPALSKILRKYFADEDDASYKRKPYSNSR